MPVITYKLASEATMRNQLMYYQTKTCLFRDWTEFYVELAGAEATAEDIFNHILITAFRRLMRETRLLQRIHGVDLRPTLKLVSAVLEKPAEGPAAWKELYEAGLIDQESFQEATYHDKDDAVGKFLKMFADEVHPSTAATAKVNPPVPAKGMTLCKYVVDFIEDCKKMPAFPPGFRVNPNTTWSEAKRLRPGHHSSGQRGVLGEVILAP